MTINYARARHFNRALSPADLSRLRAALGLAVPPPWTDAALDAVAAWQVAQGLVGDGMVGPRTLAALPRPMGEEAARAVPLSIAEASREHPDEAWVVDVSIHRPNLDLHRLARETNTRGLIVKATMGAHSADATGAPYTKQARAAGLVPGSYAWPYPVWQGKITDSAPQVANYTRWLAAHAAAGDISPHMDIEAGSIGNVDELVAAVGTQGARAWFARLFREADRAMGDGFCGIYTNRSTLEDLGGVDACARDGLLDRPTWLAYYPRSGAKLPTAQPPKWDRDWSLWQMNSDGIAPGYDKGLDFNVVNRASALYRLLKGSPC